MRGLPLGFVSTNNMTEEVECKKSVASIVLYFLLGVSMLIMGALIISDQKEDVCRLDAPFW